MSSALLFWRGQSSRVTAPSGEAAQVDCVNDEMSREGGEEVPPPEEKGAEEETGQGGEGGPEAEGAPGTGVEEGEEEARREEAERLLDRAAEEEFLGEAGEEGEGDGLGGGDRPQHPGERRLQLAGEREKPAREVPGTHEEEPRRRSGQEVEAEAA